MNSEHRDITESWSQKSECRKAEAVGICGEAYRSEGFPGGSVVKNSTANEGDTRDGGSGSIPGWGRSPGLRNDNPF